MRTIKIYRQPGRAAPVENLLAALDPKLRAKLLRQLWQLRVLPLGALKEPHFKHFTTERYARLYEVREKSRVRVRIVFTILGHV